MKIALVCSHGGHLTELLYIMQTFEDHEVFFATYDSERTRAMNHRKYLFPNFGEKPLKMLKNLPRILNIMSKEKPDVIISNGAEIAIPFFFLGKLFRAKTIFIECYTRISEPTITGKLVYPLADLFLVLWPDLLKKYGKKAQYWGGLFEIIEKQELSSSHRGEFIFVTVGMHYAGFERLIRKMDEVAGKVNEKVVMQIGNTQYEPINAEYFKFKDSDNEIREYMRKARLVVCPGAMTILDSLIEGTPVIAVPRLRDYGEHLNNHQLIFAKKLEDLGLIKVVRDIENLENFILNIDYSNSKSIAINQLFTRKIREFIQSRSQE